MRMYSYLEWDSTVLTSLVLHLTTGQGQSSNCNRVNQNVTWLQSTKYITHNYDHKNNNYYLYWTQKYNYIYTYST